MEGVLNMINKIDVGNRICELRKRANLSQAAFAERLSVSSQAISKWETGQALPDVELLLSISWMFKVTINEILEGNNILHKIANRKFEMDNIAYFVPKDERDYNIEWAKNMIAGGWIKKNWEIQKSKLAAYKAIAKKITSRGGLILEIGTGPGGGFMPATLLEDFDANVIISDLSPTVVSEWKKLFDNEYNPPNVYYAALDNCELPFTDNSIDVVSSAGGFGNTEGDKFQAIHEIYRVLKPGGLFVSSEGYVTQHTLKQLPEDVQKVLLEKRPDIFENFYDALAAAGFRTIDSRIGYGWSTKNDKSTIADLARELGIEIVFTGYTRYCEK
jgi:ubiquinone/menaquinone biosynthesis C-methylase UbiE/DNA-binding XRE family transcriptional regulator